jgi:hypothetical protein
MMQNWEPPAYVRASDEKSTANMAPLPSITEADMLQLGLKSHNCPFSAGESARKAQMRTFQRLYGIDPKTCLDAFEAIQTIPGPDRISGKKPNSYDLLVTVEWLRTYKTELDLACTYHLDESTVSKFTSGRSSISKTSQKAWGRDC